MAWVAVKADGTAAAVAFMQEQLTVESGMNLVEMDDALVIAVMEGQRSLNSLFDPAPAPAITETLQHLAASTRALRWTNHGFTSRYPALMSDDDVEGLIQIAGMVKADGIAVEVGSRFGGSAKCIMDHAPSIKRLYCIDPNWYHPIDSWHDITELNDHWKVDAYGSCAEFAQKLLSDYSQVRLLPFSSPDDIQWWREPIDFLFEDSSHWNPQLRATLDFWVPLVKSGGIIAGHDYLRNIWLDVVQEVDALAQRLGAELHVLGGSTVWWMRKP